MKRFSERWKECVRLARGNGLDERPAPAEVVVGLRPDWRSLVRAGEGGRAVDDAGLWEWYGARGLAVASVVLAACVFFSVRGPREVPSLRPGVEDAVAEVLWSL